MVQGFFFLKIMAANDSEYLASQPQSSALVFRGFEAPGKQAGGLFSAKNGPAGPGIGGGALNKLFAKCINFALLASTLPHWDKI